VEQAFRPADKLLKVSGALAPERARNKPGLYQPYRPG